jgi:predicted secreted protein
MKDVPFQRRQKANRPCRQGQGGKATWAIDQADTPRESASAEYGRLTDVGGEGKNEKREFARKRIGCGMETQMREVSQRC